MTGAEIVQAWFSNELEWNRNRRAPLEMLMPGDIGAVAMLLTKLLGYAVDDDGYSQWSRDRKLARLMEGIDSAIANHDESGADVLFAEYRRILLQSGP